MGSTLHHNIGDKRANPPLTRLCMQIYGTVQGVGFRPFVYQLASNLGLNGWVNNSTNGVQIEVEGTADKLFEFINRLDIGKPPLASILSKDVSFHRPAGYTEFAIRQSNLSGIKNALVLPDVATCPDCLSEITDLNNRRYRYPFTNCTNCGPRYSVIESLPYDRKNTTMKIFPMCDECRAEYEDPLNRRFHAQPNACPGCGPHLELWNKNGRIISTLDQSLHDACDAVKSGKIVALKGLGGFQLLADAQNEEAVIRLRERKAREEKPFALMYPGPDAVKNYCLLSDLEKKSLVSPQSPIVLLKRRDEIDIKSPPVSASVAPENNYFGVMLPYTPLHHLLMAELNSPVVATSGNLSDEPICIDEYDALERLKSVADLFLVHNRPIARQVDDSVVRVVMARELIIRNARGYAPVAIQLQKAVPSCLAVGAHLKNSVAISVDRNVFISQHVGDLGTRQAYDAFARTITSLSNIYDFEPEKTVSDMHPDYLSTKYAEELALPTTKVQHHYAHVLSCMADNQLEGPALGISWDGTGLGLDGTIWGGEFLRADYNSFARVAYLRTFRLPGGEKAIEEPQRSAIGLLYEIFGERLFSSSEIDVFHRFKSKEKAILRKMLENNINSPVTSSAGRLFDAMASIVGLCQIAGYEGHAAMKLESVASETETDESYNFNVGLKSMPYMVNWEPMVHDVLNDLKLAIPVNLIAAKFHNTLVEMIVHVANVIGEQTVVLTGGCFQNRYLLERAIGVLQNAGYSPFWHKRIPPNDGGIALGQIVSVSHHKLQGE